MLEILFLLVFWHVIADYPLQGDFLARAKNRFCPVQGIPWYQALSAHVIIHAGGVLLITNSLTLAITELVLHFIIDLLKCAGKLTYNQDQFLHILCKVIYVILISKGIII